MKKKPKPLYVTVFFDTETIDGFKGDAKGCQFIIESKIRQGAPEWFEGYYCIEKFFNRLINEKYYLETKTKSEIRFKIMIHNAQYDLLRFKKQLPSASQVHRVNGSMYIFGDVIYEGVTFKIQDTMTMMGGRSLADCAKAYGKVPKIEHDHTLGDIDYQDEEDLKYALNDVICLKSAIEGFSNSVGIAKNSLKLTVPSTALHIFKKFYKKKFKHNWVGVADYQNDLLRPYYYGGRVMLPVNKLNMPVDLQSLDLTSSYPAVMRNHKFPKAGAIGMKLSSGVNMLKMNGLNFCHVKVFNYYPSYTILPFRNESGETIFPTGTFETKVSLDELNWAIKQCPKMKIQWLGGIHYAQKKLDYIFRDYIDYFYDMKNKTDDESLMNIEGWEGRREVSKLLMNSLYGKTAQSKGDNNPIVINYPDYLNEDEPKEPNHSLVAVAAYVTALGRLSLYRAFEYYGAENVYYCDTDSAKILKSVYDSKPLIDKEKGLGLFKDEGVQKDFVCGGKKKYAYKKENDDISIRYLGVSLTDGLTISDGFKSIKLNKKNKINHQKVLKEIYDAIATDTTRYINYSAKPVKLRTHAKTGQLFHTPRKQLSTRKDTTGYNVINGVFQYIEMV